MTSVLLYMSTEIISIVGRTTARVEVVVASGEASTFDRVM
jgi:hypothetical protein